MVSYLIFAAIFVTLGVTGLLYGVLSDIYDVIDPIGTAFEADMGHQTDTSNQAGDLIDFIALSSPIWIFIGVVLYAFNRSQKPEVPY